MQTCNKLRRFAYLTATPFVAYKLIQSHNGLMLTFQVCFIPNIDAVANLDKSVSAPVKKAAGMLKEFLGEHDTEDHDDCQLCQQHHQHGQHSVQPSSDSE